jgi:hypothetical protein
MNTKPNILLEVASLSMGLAKKYVDPYSHPKSPHKFTQAQLLTLLVLRAYLKTTYRGVIELVEVSDALRERLRLTRLPHYSTLKKFADRSLVLAIIDRMLVDVVQSFAGKSAEIAMDSTGMETTSASSHYQTRSGRQRKKYVKLSVCVLAGAMVPAGLVVSWGPYNDKREAKPLLAKTKAALQPNRLFADKGYDAEWVHEFCRNEWNVESWIPPAVHRSDGQVNGHYRSQMTPDTLKEQGYGRRWIVESFMSGLKRTTGSTLNARQEQSLFVEAALRVLAYALRR